LPIFDCQLPIDAGSLVLDLWPWFESLESQRPKTKDPIGNWQSEIGNG